METQTVIFIGPQGSGKGTQLRNLKKDFEESGGFKDVLSIETGALFRELLKKQDTFAEKKIAESLNKGFLQPDFLTNALWGNEMLKRLDAESHLLIDGFPRNMDQAAVLDEALEFFERDNLTVINLDTPEDVVKERMTARGRGDDTEESIQKRLELYHKDTAPVIEYYRTRKNTRVLDIDGSASIEDVMEHMRSAFDF